jgi:hypothetical protein
MLYIIRKTSAGQLYRDGQCNAVITQAATPEAAMQQARKICGQVLPTWQVDLLSDVLADGQSAASFNLWGLVFPALGHRLPGQ